MENPLPPEEQPVPEKPGRFLLAAGAVLGIMVVAALGVYAWYAVYGPCTRGTVDTASTALFEQVAAFEQAYRSAASTTPIGLIGPVTTMQQVVWDTREVEVPACMQIARNELITRLTCFVLQWFFFAGIQQALRLFQDPFEALSVFFERFLQLAPDHALRDFEKAFWFAFHPGGHLRPAP
jgi:hypothetical protein